jgi:tetratricopeptide (TPR) repeat protein
LIKKAHLEKTHSNKIKIFNEALDLFKKVVEINPYDYLGLYHLSLCYALLRKITESIDVIQKALMLKSDDKDCLHLLCLLLTSTKNYEEAYTVILKACSIYEDFEYIIIFTYNIKISFSQSKNYIYLYI